MANINYAPLEQLSCWLEYRLVTDKLDPPVFRCRLRPVTGLNYIDGEDGSGFKLSRAVLEIAIDAVAEWDLTAGGVPVPLTAETKRGYLIPIIDQQVEGLADGNLLGVVLVRDGQRRENFLKN